MRPFLATMSFLFWLGFSVTNGFEINTETVRALENSDAEKLIFLPDPSFKLDKKALPYGKTQNFHQLAMKKKAGIKPKWMNQLNEEDPIDKEEADFLNSEGSKLLNADSFDSEIIDKESNKSKWNEYIEEDKETKDNTYEAT